MPPPYVERAPSAPQLAGVVTRLWWLRMPAPSRRERIVPQPAVHLVVNLGEPYRVVSRGGEPVGHEVAGAFLAGLHLDPLVNENPALLHHVGAAIEPWALAALGIDPVAAAGAVLPADRFLPGIDAARDGWRAAAPDEALAALEADLAARRIGGWSPDRRVVEAVGALAADPARPMAALAAGAGLSGDGFTALFRRHCGVTPKRFAAVQRLQHFLRELPAERELPTWTELLARGAFYDQPHFSREFRRLMGMTPSAYVEHRRRFGAADPSFLVVDD